MAVATDSLDLALVDLGEALARVEALLDTDLDAEAGVMVLRVLDWSRDEPQGYSQRLAAMLSEFRTRLARSLPAKVLTVDGVGMVERVQAGATEKWDGRALAFRVAALVGDTPYDPADGDLLPPGVLAMRVAEELVKCAGLDAASKSWRKTELRARNIDPGEFVERDGGRPSVRWK